MINLQFFEVFHLILMNFHWNYDLIELIADANLGTQL